MNKLLIVLLAVCLVSAHAFVKRDVEPSQQENYLEKYKKDIEDFTKNVGDKLQEAFNPDQIKKGFNEIVDTINKAVGEISPKKEAAKE